MSEILQKVRVFWHELGHFVAQQYNRRFFGGYGTDHLVIRRQQLPNQNTDYVGATMPIAPPDYKSTDPIKHPASMIAAAVYGCFFQCAKYILKLEACLGPRHTGVHGYVDFEKVVKAQRECLASLESRDLIDKCIQEYFEAIQKLPEVAELFQEDITGLVVSEQNEFYLDLEMLNKRFADFLDIHEKFYLRFVSDLEKIFNQYKGEGNE